MIRVEIKNFVNKFIESNKGRTTPFSMAEIERKFNSERKKKNKQAMCLSNMDRLFIVCLLMKVKGIKRNYEVSRHGGFRELFEFREVEEEKEVCLYSMQ